MIKFDSSFRWSSGCGPGGSGPRKRLAHQALDSQIIKDTNKFVPRKTGELASSPLRASTVGEIVYDRPYARRLYYGVKMKFNRAFHPLAGPRWLDRSKAIWFPKWLEIVIKLLRGRG